MDSHTPFHHPCLIACSVLGVCPATPSSELRALSSLAMCRYYVLFTPYYSVPTMIPGLSGSVPMPTEREGIRHLVQQKTALAWDKAERAVEMVPLSSGRSYTDTYRRRF